LTIYLNKSEFTPLFPVNIDSAAIGAISTIEKLEGAPILSYLIEPINKHGIKGRRLIALSNRAGDYTEIFAELYADKYTLIQIITIVPNQEENRLLRTRILSSLEFYL
jgi:hypothetical protein